MAYASRTEFVGQYPPEILSVALAFFCIADGDATAAMCGTAIFRRDCSGMISIASAVAGAWKEIDVLDDHIVPQVDRADVECHSEERGLSIVVLANEMLEPILHTLQEKNETVTSFRSIL